MENYRSDDTGGINLYPQFDYDLSIILDFVRTEFIGLDQIFE